MSSTGSTTETRRTARPPKEAAPRVLLDMQSSTLVRLLLVGTLFFAAVNVVQELRSFIITLSVAAFLAIAADPLVGMLQRRGMGRGAAVGILLLGLVTVLGTMVAIFVPPLVDQGDRLVENAPTIVQDLKQNDLLRRLDTKYDVLDKAQEQAATLPGKVSQRLGTVLGALLAGVAGTLTILFLMVLLLMGGDRLVLGTAKLFPQIAERRWWEIIQGAYRSISAYVAGTLLIAFIAGATMVIALLALGLPYPLPLGLWMMLLGVIPLIGATLGAIPALVVAFAAGGVVKGLALLGIVIVYQQVENILIQPRIQGKVVSLPPLIIFMSVLIGSQLMGVLGALFAVPVAGVIQILYSQYVGDTAGDDMELPPIAPDHAPEAPEVEGEDAPPAPSSDTPL